MDGANVSVDVDSSVMKVLYFHLYEAFEEGQPTISIAAHWCSRVVRSKYFSLSLEPMTMGVRSFSIASSSMAWRIVTMLERMKKGRWMFCDFFGNVSRVIGIFVIGSYYKQINSVYFMQK